MSAPEVDSVVVGVLTPMAQDLDAAADALKATVDAATDAVGDATDAGDAKRAVLAQWPVRDFIEYFTDVNLADPESVSRFETRNATTNCSVDGDDLGLEFNASLDQSLDADESPTSAAIFAAAAALSSNAANSAIIAAAAADSADAADASSDAVAATAAGRPTRRLRLLRSVPNMRALLWDKRGNPVVFRGARQECLRPEEVDAFMEFGVKTIVDLRSC